MSFQEQIFYFKAELQDIAIRTCRPSKERNEYPT